MVSPVKKKVTKQALVAALFLTFTLTFTPVTTAIYIICGILDVMRNKRRDFYTIQRHFAGNGFTTWMAAPVNLLFDLLCYRNKRIYRLEDFPEAAQQEIRDILQFFKDRQPDLQARIREEMDDAKRGMFVFRWFGLTYNTDYPEFDRPWRHVRTVAVSAFRGQERTNFHFGPQRLTLRLLFNLTPVPDSEVFIEVGNTRHYWRDDPMFIFDDTLMHRSVNDDERPRFVVFLDVMRPSPIPAVTAAFVLPISFIARLAKSIYYRRWKMLGATPRTT